MSAETDEKPTIRTARFPESVEYQSGSTEVGEVRSASTVDE